nr:hypothetical protein [Tanacetum cinerariifolium]
IGIRVEAIENQVKNVLLDYNHFKNIALVKKRLHGTFMHTFMHMLVAALVEDIMSDSEDSTVTYTTVSSPYEGRSGDVSPGVDGALIMPEDPYAYPLVATASPTAESPGYILESDPDEDLEEDDDKDPKEDPAYYLADHDDKEEEEEPSGDDADEEDEEQDEDDDDEEEEHLALADSIPPLPALVFLAMLIPPPLPLTPLSSPLPQIPSPPLPASPPILPIPLPTASPPLQLLSSDRRADRPEVTFLPRKRLSIVHYLRYEVGESSVAAATRLIEGRRADYGFVDSIEAEIRQRRVEDIGYGLSSAVHFELQGYITHTWVKDQRIDAQDTLIASLTTQLSSLQEHLAMTLCEIRALQARE